MERSARVAKRRFTWLLAGLLAFVPAAAFAQQDQVVNRVLGNVPDLVTSTVDPELSAGTIRVQVVDASNQPVAKQPVRLGVMEQSGKRENPVMKGLAASLSERDMEDLAAYFSSQDGLAAPEISN